LIGEVELMSETYITTATVSNKKTLILDKSLPLAGRVRVTIEELPEEKPETSFLAKLQVIHQALLNSGYQQRSKDVIDSQIREERESWGE